MRRVHFLVLVLFVCAGFGAFAGGQPEIPEIPPITSGTQYLSPNGDGVKETAAIQFSVTIYVKSKEGYVPEYGLEIKDQSGEIIKQVVEKEDRDIGWLRSLFTGYKEFTLERSVTWDGKDADGNVADDGTYGLSLWVMSASGVRQEQALDDFIVDTKAPEALIVEPERLVFSPNNDGNRDEITISHTKSTVEKEWTAEIRSDSGEVVRTFSWTNSEPGRAVWDGTADNGTAAPEGTYSYVLSATDEAGNESGEITLEGIELDRTSTPIEVVIDPQYISPNGDGRQDTARVFFDQAVDEGIIGWEWKLTDRQGRTVLSESGGTADVPRETMLDGTGQGGTPLAEGDYTFT
ncbi:MAG: FlgD immunoglobulin-like domain containing protein, partial [Sediminispirochaetaceae bacterium]